MTTASIVGETSLTIPSDREIVFSLVVDAPCAPVFEAWTSAEHVPYWMLGPDGWPMPVCEIDLRAGGRWRFAWRRSDGAEVGMHGRYRAVTPRRRVVYTEALVGDSAETLNTVLFSEEDGKTTITYTVRYGSPEARDAALRRETDAGVAATLENLAGYLAAMS